MQFETKIEKETFLGGNLERDEIHYVINICKIYIYFQII